MNALFKVETPLKNELMTTVRLAASGLCSLCELSYDDGEDCKVCVTESLLILTRAGYESAELAFYRENGIRIVAEGSGEPVGGEKEDDGISAALLSALAEDVNMENRGGIVSRISFRFSVRK